MAESKFVVCNNDMNLVPLRHFTPLEQDLLYGICLKLRDQGERKVQLSFEELKEVCSYDRNSTLKEFAEELASIYDKMLKITCRYTEGKRIKGFVLFIDYDIDYENQKAKIGIHPEFTYLLNNLTNNFTKFEIAEFVSLSSSYAKTAYRLIKQYRKTGYLVLDIEEFRELFCIPKTYQMCNIDIRVLKPIIQELSPIFRNFRIEKIKARKGRKIEKIEFIFDYETDVSKDGTKTFRAKETGEFYQTNLMDFNQEEHDAEYPAFPNPISDQIKQ